MNEHAVNLTRGDAGSAVATPQAPAEALPLHEQAAGGLTGGEQSRLSGPAPRAATGVAPAAEVDVAGHAIAEYDDGFGYKGRPGTNPAHQPASAGRGGLLNLIPDPYKQIPGIVKRIPGTLISGVRGGITWPPF